MWSAYLYQTVTGRIGPRVEYESHGWSIELNGVETINVKLKKSSLPLVDKKYWLAAWWAGVVLMWNDKPVVAGPIITRPFEDQTSIHINAGGVRSILSARVLVPEMKDWATLNQQEIPYYGKSLGTIAKEVVKRVQQKSGGSLPITYAVPDETVLDDADHQRVYESFNVHNLFADDILTKLSNVSRGPDIMFKPYILNGNTLFHEMWNGTEKQPRIYQSQTQVWDTTPEQGQVTNMSVVYTGTYQASRVFSTGAGQDKGTLIQVNTNETPIQQQFPLLERTINSGDSDNPTVVSNHGKGILDANENALLEVQMTVRGDAGIPFGSFWPGDLAHVITKGWISLEDGNNPMRILSMTGDHTNNVRLSLQLEDRYS